MKTIHTDGISYIEPVPGGTSGWYFGVSLEHGDLYEAEEICSDGFPVEGNSLVLIRYPDGAVFRPLPKQAGTYSDTPVFLDGSIFCLNVDFLRQLIRIVRFDCKSGEVRTEAELPLGAVKNCYNLKLHTSPLCLTRQGDDDVFEIVWPEKARFPLGLHESFFPARRGEAILQPVARGRRRPGLPLLGRNGGPGPERESDRGPSGRYPEDAGRGSVASGIGDARHPALQDMERFMGGRFL